MPDLACIHLLSISREKINTTVSNGLGNWLMFGYARLGQLLVWEWRSESYILKQQGHYFDVNSIAYSPDSQLLATGGDDNKVKVWTISSGFCFVTFTKHTYDAIALHFMATNHCLLSASLDGTVMKSRLDLCANEEASIGLEEIEESLVHSRSNGKQPVW